MKSQADDASDYFACELPPGLFFLTYFGPG